MIFSASQKSTQRPPWQPSEIQELALRAILARTDADALRFWKLWEEKHDWDSIEYGLFMVMPFLFKRLEHIAPALALGYYRGAYRLAWYKNTVTVARLQKVLPLLENAGLQPILLKGTALVLYYKDVLRPITDADVWISKGQAPQAMDILEANGWRRQGVFSRGKAFRVAHAAAFKDAQGFELDVHWYFAWCARKPSVDAYFRTQTIEAEWQGQRIRLFRPEALLFHVCLHGARVGEYSRWESSGLPRTFQWIIDAATILAANNSAFDWNLFTHYAALLHAERHMHAALQYLATYEAISIPASVLQTLSAANSMLSHAHYRLTMENRRRGVLARASRLRDAVLLALAQ